MPEISERLKSTLIECADDYTGLWSVIADICEDVKDANGKVNISEVKERTLKTLRNLLENKLIQAGFPVHGGGFEPWGLSTDEVIERIKNEWDMLGRDPRLGEVAWFSLTEAGKRKVLE